jgi:REP element-mobilizing transposase RayT
MGEYYHIYNRGVDKRNIFEKPEDFKTFLDELEGFNSILSVGGLYAGNLMKRSSHPRGSTSSEKLVEIVAFCLNQNHFHLILTPLVEDGIQKFMQRISTGYTMYFNENKERTGALFQGRYKAKHINSNEYLLYLSAYVNLNFMVHGYDNNHKYISSWFEYVSPETSKTKLTNPDIVTGQHVSREKYKIDAMEVATNIAEKRKEDKALNNILID